MDVLRGQVGTRLTQLCPVLLLIIKTQAKQHASSEKVPEIKRMLSSLEAQTRACLGKSHDGGFCLFASSCEKFQELKHTREKRTLTKRLKPLGPRARFLRKTKRSFF